jgi:hypothetical protein
VFWQHDGLVRSTSVNIALTVWLTASIGIWLLGVAFAGAPYVPYPNAFTLLLIYGPWLVLLVVIVSNWGQRHGVRAAKPAALLLGALIGFLILLFPHRGLAKERFFNAVLSSCQVRHGVERVLWQGIPAFDGNVRRFRAKSAADKRLVDCVSQGAGFVVTDLICPGESPWPEGGSALEVSFGTSHTIPAEHFFDIVHYEFAGRTRKPTAIREQCP